MSSDEEYEAGFLIYEIKSREPRVMSLNQPENPEKRRERERRRKKKKKKRYSSSSEDSEAEDKRITKKAKKKLGLSDSDEEIELTVRERDARTVVATQLRIVFKVN